MIKTKHGHTVMESTGIANPETEFKADLCCIILSMLQEEDLGITENDIYEVVDDAIDTYHDKQVSEDEPEEPGREIFDTIWEIASNRLTENNDPSLLIHILESVAKAKEEVEGHGEE